MENKNKKIITIATIIAAVILAVIAIITAIKLYQIGQEPTAPKMPEQAPAAPADEDTGAGCYQVCNTDSDCPSDQVCGSDWCPPGQNCITALQCYNPNCPYDDTCLCSYPSCYKPCEPGSCDPGLVCGSDWCPPGQNCITIDQCYSPYCPYDDTCLCSLGTGPSPDCTLKFTITGETGTPTPTPTPNPDCWDVCDSNADCSGDLECQDVGGTDRCVNPDCSSEEDCICSEETTPTPTSTPGPGATSTPTTPPEEAGEPVLVTATPVPELPEAGFSLPTAGTILGGLLLIIISLALAL